MIDQKILASSRMSRKSQFFYYFFYFLYMPCCFVWFYTAQTVVLVVYINGFVSMFESESYQCLDRNDVHILKLLRAEGFNSVVSRFLWSRMRLWWPKNWDKGSSRDFLLNIRDEFWLIFCGFLFLFVCVLLVELCCVVLSDTTNFLFLIEKGFYLQ